jgi:hypothetical protein
VTARGRTVQLDRSLAERVEALLRALGWFGLAELQFIDGQGPEPFLLDLNGRFYGSLALAVGSGSNLPAIWAALATGRAAPAASPRPGTRYQWLEGDMRCAVRARQRRASELIRTLRYGRGAHHSLGSLRDPGPALVYALRLGWRVLRRALRPTRRGGREPPASAPGS